MRQVLSSTTVSMVLALASASALPACSGCGNKTEETQAPAAAPATTHGLTAEQAAQVLVKIGGTTITVGEFADELSSQSPYLRARYANAEKRREFLDNMVRFELLAAEAQRQGLDREGDVERTRKQMMIQELMKTEFEDRIQLTDITDEQVREYYEAHPAEFRKPEQVRVSHIFMRNRGAAERLLAQVKAKKDDVAFFRSMAERNNEDPTTRDRFGDLRFISRTADRAEGEPELDPALVEAAFALTQVGDIAPALVAANGGFHILKLTGRRAPMNRSLEEASRSIRTRLWRERREKAITDFVAQLRAQANITVNDAALGSLRIDIPSAEDLQNDHAAGEHGDHDAPPAPPGAGPRVPGAPGAGGPFGGLRLPTHPAPAPAP